MDEARWAAERIVARIWWCGDDECDCTQPLIERIMPNRDVGYPWIRRETLWSGEFISFTYELTNEERESRHYEPLREECHRFGVPVPRRVRRYAPRNPAESGPGRSV